MSSRIGLSDSCAYVGNSLPCLRRMYGWTALPWMGPGRMIATSTTRSLNAAGRVRGRVIIWARDSIWKTPIVSAAAHIS